MRVIFDVIYLHRNKEINIINSNLNKPESIHSNNKIILFDGVCNLCSGFMHFVYKNDPGGVFKFVWLQDEVGIEILKWIGLPVNKYESIIKDYECTFYTSYDYIPSTTNLELLYKHFEQNMLNS